MPEAYGYITWQSPNQAEGHFNIGGPDYICSLRTNSQLPYFMLNSAKLNYDSTDQLAGTRSLDGHVGVYDFATTFDNSSKIEGNLDNLVNQNSRFYGTATWSQRM
ncbi:hypothetical protein BO83DRAFT_422717 [Aspergillus eucalypticola CBS 122712]|uniref:Uncharacterized protein n=1 Tax=Aspergillus eucalypticola (strain CBS 122712 / IBT 29274) TaxID=1448314 RepID=A0A317WFP1_ASPEC|nr:uncharacterized protein BO83DRAFT_422717 [Aspergillus eucalypticola CBS 122712]PWY84067.1 hypothetical protein BO83DRAFT_422717 [Aspergillus eucalypticola CBS 122712]